MTKEQQRKVNIMKQNLNGFEIPTGKISYAYGSTDNDWKHCWLFWRGDLENEHIFISGIIDYYTNLLAITKEQLNDR